MERYIRSFAAPDEVVEIETVRSEMITQGGMTVSHDVQQPGWRWSVHIRPLVGTEWCQVRHIGVVLLLGMAGAHEILVSAVTASLAADAGIVFEDRGEHEMRGLVGPRRIYAVA
jgi:hypothetical protein